jgi:hypothetical protein
MTAPSAPTASNTLLLRVRAQVEALQASERAFAKRVRQDLLDHPGYYLAAVSRNRELLQQYASRPHWEWAAKRWAEIFATGGLPGVLALFTDSEANQELISASPFCLMRPPLPENDYYASHAEA